MAIRPRQNARLRVGKQLVAARDASRRPGSQPAGG